MRDKVKMKMKGIGKPRPVLEGEVGDDLHRNSGKYMHLERRIDRQNNRYRELIVDPETGKIVKDVDEPLTQHRGHGSAKSG